MAGELVAGAPVAGELVAGAPVAGELVTGAPVGASVGASVSGHSEVVLIRPSTREVFVVLYGEPPQQAVTSQYLYSASSGVAVGG